jgi:hypothetical protein
MGHLPDPNVAKLYGFEVPEEYQLRKVATRAFYGRHPVETGAVAGEHARE